MSNKNERTKALRGAERQTLELIAEVLKAEEWEKLLAVPLRRAVARGNRGLAQKLVRAGAGIGSALHEAAGGGHIGIANDLLENGASVAIEDGYDRTPLHVTASKGQTEMVQLLLLKGADKDALDCESKTPLFSVVENNNVAAVRALLTAGADVSLTYGMRFSRRTVLHIATHQRNVEILRMVIEHGADVNATDCSEFTALHLAALENTIEEVIDVLVEAGADIEARTRYDETPLHFAVDDEVKPVAVTALLKHGANVNAQDDTDTTPLHAAARIAAIAESPELVNVLLRSGADVDAQDESGDTPLHNAARFTGIRRVAEVVDFLLRSGANETITNNNGKKAVDVVGEMIAEEDHLVEDVNHVKELLANAPADRVWRRRGYLVLCRAHPDRLQLGQESANNYGGKARRTGNRTQLARAEAGGCTETVEGSLVGENMRTGGSNWTAVVAKVLGLQEEGIFRTIVGYL